MSKIYKGQPHEILNEMLHDITDVLDNAGMQVTGLHLLAMTYLVAGQWREHNEEMPDTVPSFDTMLKSFVKTATGSEWNEAEKEALSNDFVRVLRGNGGDAFKRSAGAPFMAPGSDTIN